MWKILGRASLIFLSTYLLFRFISFYPTDISPNRIVSFKINNVEGYHQLLVGDNFIYTDKGVFINRDSLLKFKFNSQDILNYLFKKHSQDADMSCIATISGYRSYWPIMLLPNIIEIQCD